MSTRKELEELAKKRGVVLADRGAPLPAKVVSESTPAGEGWLARLMPAAAPMMADLKQQLGPKWWAVVLDNLKHDRGYVVDLSTNLAVGNPPVGQYERGKVTERDGLTVMRVRPKPQE